MKKLLILDCDGVLYPASNISHNDFVEAFFQTAKNYKGKKLSIKNDNLYNAAQFWNAVYNVCREKNCDFNAFCKTMINNVNYEKIRKSYILLNLLKSTRKNFDIVVLSDNHHYHLEQILQHRFGLSIKDFAGMGINCYDITKTERNGEFFPKSESSALSNFIKRQNRKVADCIFVDNSKKNISAGRKIGMKSVYIYKNRSLLQYLRSLA